MMLCCLLSISLAGSKAVLSKTGSSSEDDGAGRKDYDKLAMICVKHMYCTPGK